MNVLAQMNTGKHEQVVFVQDLDAGLRAIIAIHNTTLGPALGGTRMYPYRTEEQALRDVLNLSRGMTDKAAAAGLDLGGGKAVIIGDSVTQKSDALLRAYGRLINRLAGVFRSPS
jgi:glutamate dehydrogenase/leucine dehydrogenase